MEHVRTASFFWGTYIRQKFPGVVGQTAGVVFFCTLHFAPKTKKNHLFAGSRTEKASVIEDCQ